MNRKLIVLAFVCLLVHQAFAQIEVVKELNEEIVKLETVSPNDEFNDLKSVSELVKGKQVIGLGEATHGTSEFFLYKHRMMKYLAMHEGYRLFIIEGDFSGSKAMNDYVVHGKGSIKDGLMGINYGVWFRQEFVAFIEWMRAFNEDRALEDRIRFYGCDINSEIGVARKLKDYLDEAGCLNGKLANGLDLIINNNLRKQLSEKHETFSNEMKVELEVAFDRIKDKQPREYEFMKQCKRELEQNIELRMDDCKNWIVLRDQFMAENIEWICEYERGKKAVFWAHNEHVMIDKAKSAQKPVGYYLKKKFGNTYYSLGFGFGEGEVIGYDRKNKGFENFAVPEISPKKSSDAVFALCKYENFFLDIKSAKEKEKIHEFLHTDLYHRAVGSVYAPEGKKRHHFRLGKLIDRFDGVIFLRKTNAASLIKSI